MGTHKSLVIRLSLHCCQCDRMRENVIKMDLCQCDFMTTAELGKSIKSPHRSAVWSRKRSDPTTLIEIAVCTNTVSYGYALPLYNICLVFVRNMPATHTSFLLF